MTEQQTGMSMAGVPQDAIKRLSELQPGKAGSIFTSDLSVNEFLLVREAGFRPLGLVLGSSIYHVGLQVGRWGKNQELTVLSQALYHARELAMTRMEAEADALGADGIVGVRLDVEMKEFGNDIAEFIAIGTAVKAEPNAGGGGVDNWRNNKRQPFTSDLSGQVADRGPGGHELQAVLAPGVHLHPQLDPDDAVGRQVVGLGPHPGHGQLPGVVHGLGQDLQLLVLVPAADLQADVVDRGADHEPERLESGLAEQHVLRYRQVRGEYAALVGADRLGQPTLGRLRLPGRRGRVLRIREERHVAS